MLSFARPGSNKPGSLISSMYQTSSSTFIAYTPLESDLHVPSCAGPAAEQLAPPEKPAVAVEPPALVAPDPPLAIDIPPAPVAGDDPPVAVVAPEPPLGAVVAPAEPPVVPPVAGAVLPPVDDGALPAWGVP